LPRLLGIQEYSKLHYFNQFGSQIQAPLILRNEKRIVGNCNSAGDERRFWGPLSAAFI
jgi:hypothetical protein